MLMRSSRLLCVFLLVCSLAHAEQEGAGSATTSAATGSNAANTALNPAISLDGLFDYSQFNNNTPLHFLGGHDPYQNGFNLQQVELTMSANVDPYFAGMANIILNHEGGIEVEEAYATTTSLPYNLQAKAGTFFTAFGRFNPIHPHAWAFVNKPLVLGRMFGGDGLRSLGAQLSWLTPLPWFSELIVSAQNSNSETTISFLGAQYTPTGETEPVAQTMRSIKDAIVLLRSNNFVSVTDDFLANFGASYAEGKNPQTTTSRTRIVGGDIYLKYRKPEELAFIGLQAEVLRRSYDTATEQANDWGWYAELTYRLPEGWERWHVGLRYDWISDTTNPVQDSTLGGAEISAPVSGGGQNPNQGERWRISPVVTFYPSEFSKLRFQYDYDHAPIFAHAQQVGHVELEFMIGSHGAHKF
ncbi:MAG: hypothetical protein ACJ763_07625 [Bdellovibrionia bacterium]